MDIAERHCVKHGHRLTDPRRLVLAILQDGNEPLGAYAIIDAMPEGTKPPTVYRALEFWEREGFVHRIDSLNVYAACHAGHRHAGSQYTVCDGCGRVEEVHLCDVPQQLRERLGDTGFTLRRWTAELHGLCAACNA